MSDIRQEVFGRLLALWRRRWIVLAIAWTLCLIGWATAFSLPKHYESSARIYVDTETMLGPLLRNILVENDPHSHAQMIQRTLLSRPNLRKVAMATDLAMRAKSTLEEANLYEMLEKSTTISAQGTNLFSISFVNSDPVVARNVVQALITILVETNTGQKRGDMEEARGFIEKQITTYETDLRAMEKRMAEFRAAHVEDLAEGSNFGARLDQAHLTTANAKSDLADDEAKLEHMRSTLAKTPQYIDVESSPQVVVTNQVDPVRQRITDMQRNLDSLKLRFTEMHPDVIAAQKELNDAIQAARDKGAVDAGGQGPPNRSSVPNKLFEQMQIKLLELEQTADVARRRLEQAERDEARLAAHAASAPSVEAQYNDLARNYGALKKQYEELLARRETARLSEAVENTSTKTQFRVVEPPSLPVKPSGLPRLILLSAVLVGAIGVSVGTALLLHEIEGPVTSLDDLKKHFPYAGLGEITAVRVNRDMRSHRRNVLLFAGAAAMLFVVFCTLVGLSLIPMGSAASGNAMIEGSRHAD